MTDKRAYYEVDEQEGQAEAASKVLSNVKMQCSVELQSAAEQLAEAEYYELDPEAIAITRTRLFSLVELVRNFGFYEEKELRDLITGWKQSGMKYAELRRGRTPEAVEQEAVWLTNGAQRWTRDPFRYASDETPEI